MAKKKTAKKSRKQDQFLGLASEVFAVNLRNRKRPISEVDPSFLKKFGRRRVMRGYGLLKSRTLEQDMNNSQVRIAWRPVGGTLGELAYNLEHNRNLLKYGWVHFLFIEDGVVIAVWGGSGWLIGARLINAPNPSGLGRRVFARKFTKK